MQNVERASGRGKAQSTMSGIADKANDNIVARMNANAILANKLADPAAFAAAVAEEQERLMAAYQQQSSPTRTGGAVDTSNPLLQGG
jgi:hypothetical protein